MVFGDVGLFKRVVGEVEQFVLGLGGVQVGQIVIDDFPLAQAEHRVVAAAVAVGEVHQKPLLAVGVAIAGELFGQVFAVNDMALGYRDAGEVEDGGVKVHHATELMLDRALSDGQFLLPLVVGVRLGPGGDERSPHAALVVGAFFGP